MVCRLCPTEAKFKGLCRRCYHREYDRTPRRVEYKHRYNNTEARREYARRHSRTPAFKKNLKKFQATDKFKVIQMRYRNKVDSRYHAALRQAKKRNLEWTISFEEYNLLAVLPCHYCHQPIKTVGIGLDRKDNSVHYHPSNVVPCCGGCNRTKGDRLTYEEMEAVSALLRRMRGQDGI